MNRIQIVYFSGTGCTAMAAAFLEKALKERGREAEVLRITAGCESGAFDADALVLLFPVYACTAPGPVIEWLRYVRGANGKPAAVISVSGGGEVFPNTASRVGAVKALKRKGYDVFFEDSIVMPSNFVAATPEALATMLLQVLPEKTLAIADSLIAGDRKRMPPLLIDRIFACAGKSLVRYAGPWGRKIIVSDECDGCGICAGQCSTGNIIMDGSKPEFSDKCCLCLGCFYACPRVALKPVSAKFMIVKGFDLEETKEKAKASEKTDVSRISAGLIWLGVKKYLSGF